MESSAGPGAERKLLGESAGGPQGTGSVPCRTAETFHFSKSSKALLSVQASSMMSQSGLS
jgi:hypothetical protein